eukprot:UN01125
MIQTKSEFNPTLGRRLQYQNQTRARLPTFPSEKKMKLKLSLSEPNSPKKLQQFFGQIKKNSPNSRSPLSPDSDYIKIADNQENKIQKLKFENTMSEPIFMPKIPSVYAPKPIAPQHRKTPSQGNSPIGMANIGGKKDNKKIDKHTKLTKALNVLVLQGFYSRKSLVSHQQLTKYNDKGHKLKTIHE